ncbi:hypothetical protein SRB5_53070 [Streptomyces sp. RB5]|uniref:Uncharacterized protein n=1 Tax=Streptomyces smaragdinus TaxID=2585196 RepID=A0A7K0CNU7_9ACTN|nr:hypothetical protein [Streptomyces smaragdinus]
MTSDNERVIPKLPRPRTSPENRPRPLPRQRDRRNESN